MLLGLLCHAAALLITLGLKGNRPFTGEVYYPDTMMHGVKRLFEADTLFLTIWRFTSFWS